MEKIHNRWASSFCFVLFCLFVVVVVVVFFFHMNTVFHSRYMQNSTQILPSRRVHNSWPLLLFKTAQIN